MNVGEFFDKGGVAMWPLLVLSVLSVGTIVERIGFWAKILLNERAVVDRILEAVRSDWGTAGAVAQKAKNQPMGRFLAAPLKLDNPDPELFRLALESSADEELAAMRKGDKILEASIALSPLLGLLGTVLGLIDSLGSIRIGDLGTDATSGATLGIGEALISTATGLVVAIGSLAFYRLFQGMLFSQAKLFRRAGNELELIYRQAWARGLSQPLPADAANDGSNDQ